MTIAPTATFTVVQPTVTLADPHVLSDIRDRRSIIDALFDTLVRRDDSGNFIPWLAESWETDVRCQRWRFQLRANVLCHNGVTLSARDAELSLLRALSPEMPGELGTQGVLRSYLHGASITADANTLIVETAQPFADLLDLLVDIPVVPANALSILPQQPTGSGPYQLEQQQPGLITLRAFSDYWAGKPPVETLIWRAEPDALQRLALLTRGHADLVVDPPLTTSTRGVEIISQPGYLCIIFLLNLFSGATQDIRVRKALSHAINIEEIIAAPEIAAGHASPLAGPLTARHPGANPHISPYRYDPDAARQLLAEAGYADGLNIELALPARFPDESIALAQQVAQQLQAIGVTANLTVYEDRPAYAQRVRDKQFGDICCFDSSPASGWRVFREKLDSREQGPWWQGYHSAPLNHLLDKAAATRDAQARAAIMQQAFTVAHDDAPWLFLYAPDHHWALGTRAAGWQPCVEGRVRII